MLKFTACVCSFFDKKYDLLHLYAVFCYICNGWLMVSLRVVLMD